MAAWQYDFSFIPRRWIVGRFGAIPPRIDLRETREEEWWKHEPAGFDFEARSSAILTRGTSWSPSAKCWGQEDEDRVDLYRDASRLTGASVRVDLRQPSHEFVAAIVAVAAEAGCVLCNTEGAIIEPRLDDVLSDILESDAARFVTDPVGFLAALSGPKQAE